MKIITPIAHATLDYILVIGLVAAPSVFPISEDLSTFVYCLAGVHLLLTAVTRFSGNASFKIIPFTIHGIIEIVVAASLLLLGFTVFDLLKPDQYFLIGLSALIILVFLFTDFKKGTPT